MGEVYFTERAKARLEEHDTEVPERIKSKLKELCDWPEHFLNTRGIYPILWEVFYVFPG